MPLWEDNTSKEERGITGKAVIGKFRQHILLYGQYILLNQPFLSLHKISEFLSSLAWVDLPELYGKVPPYYLKCPVGSCRHTVSLLHQCSPLIMVRTRVGSTVMELHGKHSLFGTTVIIRESGRTFGLLLSYGSLTQESDRAHKMAFIPANLRVTLSCPSDWESDMVRTTLFFLGEITLGSPDSDSRNFLSPPRAFSTLEIIQVNIQKPDSNTSCKCISVLFFSCVAPVLFENVYHEHVRHINKQSE